MARRTSTDATLTADMVLFTRLSGNWHVLLITRGKAPFKGRLALPGGYLDPSDTTPLAGALRELREETGVRLATADPVGIYETPGRDPRGNLVSHAFTAITSGLTPKAGDDAATARWIPLAEATASRLAFDHHQILTDAMRLYAITR